VFDVRPFAGKASALVRLCRAFGAQEIPDLKDKLLQWLQFWQYSSNQGGSSSYMLLASAEVTLGVRTILQLLRRRLWMPQKQQQQQQQQQRGSSSSANSQRQQQQTQAHALRQAYDDLRRLGLVRTLYDLGQQTNAELLRDILQDSQVRPRCVISVEHAHKCDQQPGTSAL
jgi:hypothetical protein